MTNMGINEFLEKWGSGIEHDRKAMCDAGWYDWFCTDRGLYGRLKKMVPAIRRIARSEKVNDDTMYIFFKNNCPCWVDETYDDFRICDKESGDVLYCITPRYPSVPTPVRSFWGASKKEIVYVSTVWDFVADEETKTAYHIENLVQGKPVESEDCVVHGTRKEMYSYFGV